MWAINKMFTSKCVQMAVALLGYSAPGDKTGNLCPLVAVSGHSAWTFSPGLAPMNKLTEPEITVKLLFSDHTFFINPASISTKNMFHQMRGSITSVFELVSSLFHVFATQPRFLSAV